MKKKTTTKKKITCFMLILSTMQNRNLSWNFVLKQLNFAKFDFIKILQGLPLPVNALPKTKKKYKEYCERVIVEQGPSCKLMTYTEFCAVLIQEWWRTILLKPDSPRPPPPTTDGGFSAMGGGHERVNTADTEGSERKRIINREEAAKIIQRSWRQHIVSEWSHLRISSIDSKVRTSLYSIINSTTGK